jgi:DNA-binding transcriptional MerR regulator
MAAKARVQKRLYYKIGEACKALGIQPYVLRYWETEFPALTPSKSRSGQRVYSEKELEVIRRIKELLYEEGYTIAGAKKKLEGELASGSLGEPEGDEPEEGTAGEALAPAPKPAAPPKPRAAAPAPQPEAPPGVDTDAAKRVQRLLSGIDEALQEAREILTLLGPKSP